MVFPVIISLFLIILPQDPCILSLSIFIFSTQPRLFVLPLHHVVRLFCFYSPYLLSSCISKKYSRCRTPLGNSHTDVSRKKSNPTKSAAVHVPLVLRPSRVSEKVGVNHAGVNTKIIFP
jgi:hypothetical protein